MYQGSSLKLLKSFPLFKDLTDYEMEPIVDLAIRRIYPNRTHIFMQSETIENVYFILQGQVKIYRTDIHGKEQIINVLQEGDMFPHQGFFRQDGYPAHAETTEDSILINIPIDSFEQFLLTHPEICIKIFRVLGDIIVDLQKRLEEQVLHSTYEQIIMLLLRLGERYGRKFNDMAIQLTTKFTNRELANMIGSSRETVSRTLTELRNKNAIKTNKNGYLIIYIEILEDELF